MLREGGLQIRQPLQRIALVVEGHHIVRRTLKGGVISGDGPCVGLLGLLMLREGSLQIR